jgi:hypothetical protein
MFSVCSFFKREYVPAKYGLSLMLAMFGKRQTLVW